MTDYKCLNCYLVLHDYPQKLKACPKCDGEIVEVEEIKYKCTECGLVLRASREPTPCPICGGPMEEVENG